jgi:hypothetical protein
LASLQPSLMFVGNVRVYLNEAPPDIGRLLALSINIRLGWEDLPAIKP